MSLDLIEDNPWEKSWPPWLLTVSSQWAQRELTVSSRWPKWSQPAVTEPWPGPWLTCDLAVTEPWSYGRYRDWALTSPWLSCDLAVTELWPRRDWAVTSPSRDWAVIIGPGAVTTVVTVSSRWAHSELTVSSRWQFFFSSEVNTGSGNGLMPSGNKPSPEPMLTQIYVAKWHH